MRCQRGYTKPEFFYVPEPDLFYADMDYLQAKSKCINVYSDDSGCHLYSNDEELNDKLLEYWTVKKDKLFCTKCNKFVKAY